MAVAPGEQNAATRGATRQARTQAAILDATDAVLAEGSVDEVSVAEIARRAGVSRASVFGHFGTKDELVAAAIERLAGVALADMQAAYAVDGSAFDRVMASGSAYLDLLVEHPPLLRYLITRPLRTSTSPIDERIESLIALLRSGFEEQIAEAVRAGEMRALDPRLLSYFLYGAWPGAVSLVLGPPGSALDDAEVRAAFETALAIFERGMRNA